MRARAGYAAEVKKLLEEYRELQTDQTNMIIADVATAAATKTAVVRTPALIKVETRMREIIRRVGQISDSKWPDWLHLPLKEPKP